MPNILRCIAAISLGTALLSTSMVTSAACQTLCYNRTEHTNHQQCDGLGNCNTVPYTYSTCETYCTYAQNRYDEDEPDGDEHEEDQTDPPVPE